MDDELQEVRDNFYVGNYTKALSMCEGTSASNDISKAELDALLARCCLSIPILDRLKAMQQSECAGQRAACAMAIMLRAKQDAQKNSAKERLMNTAKESADMSCAMMAAISLAMDGAYTEAVQTAKAHPTLEMQALCVFICLMCTQVNMADKLLQEMSGNNDDSAAFRLASAAVKIATGDPEEAYLTYCDLCAQFPQQEGDDSSLGSTMLQNGKAVANMQRGMYSEALEDLNVAVKTAPNDENVLVNLCAVCTHLGKKDEFNAYYTKLEQVAPTHPYVVKTQGMTSVFTRFKANLTV